MEDGIRKSNFEIAKAEADKVDTEIIKTLQSGHSFRVEAGAGSGKTYSLNKVIEWIQANKWKEYNLKKQNVVCITYTNAAVDVITGRLAKDSFIIPSTIHSFAWNAIKQYQSELLKIIKEDKTFLTDEEDVFEITEVKYTLGHRYIDNGIHYLYHDDVLKLFCSLLDNTKFRRIFSNKYPLILVDEYQDSYKMIVDRFINYFIAENEGPQFGFFGDAWQTIYQSKACGVIEHTNIVEIKKSSNFRSAPKIVELLNNIRPDLPQRSAIDNFDGEVVVVTCDDYSGDRRTDRNFKGELQEKVLKERITSLKDATINNNPPNESLKVLMITHKVLAKQQGYEQILEILDDGLKDKQDPILLFFMNTIEPIYNALSSSNMQQLFDTLGIKSYPITKKSDKIMWKELKLKLEQTRNQKAIDVLNVAVSSKLIPIPPQIEMFYKEYYKTPGMEYVHNVAISEFLQLDYNQFLNAIAFLYPDAEFSTEHGVKGEEYDNVIFVIGRGWNQYQFEVYMPMLNSTSIPEEKKAAFIRNRNLFYVCCSRPKKRLIIFVTIPLEYSFRDFLTTLVGKDNIFTYSEYLNLKKSNT